jgi:hypothetical protein
MLLNCASGWSASLATYGTSLTLSPRVFKIHTVMVLMCDQVSLL